MLSLKLFLQRQKLFRQLLQVVDPGRVDVLGITSKSEKRLSWFFIQNLSDDFYNLNGL